MLIQIQSLICFSISFKYNSSFTRTRSTGKRKIVRFRIAFADNSTSHGNHSASVYKNVNYVLLHSYLGKCYLPLSWFFMHYITLTRTINKPAAESRSHSALLSGWQRSSMSLLRNHCETDCLPSSLFLHKDMCFSLSHNSQTHRLCVYTVRNSSNTCLLSIYYVEGKARCSREHKE